MAGRPDKHVTGVTFVQLDGRSGETLHVKVQPNLPALFFGFYLGSPHVKCERVLVAGRDQPFAVLPIDGGVESFVGVPTVFAPAEVPIEAYLRCSGRVSSGMSWMIWLDREASRWLEIARGRQRAAGD